MGRRRQHSKGKARPRSWHHGRAQGKVNDRVLQQHEAELVRAAAAAATVEAGRAELAADVREHGAMIQALRHAAPFVPSWWPA